MVINKNGGGSFTIKYILDKGLQDISTQSEKDSVIPLNLSEDYLKEVILNRDDISYDNYIILEENDRTVISVRFSFKSIEGLNSILPEDNRISLERDGRSTILKQGLTNGKQYDINSESLEILQEIFRDHYFKMRITTPENITSINLGVLLNEKSTEYRVDLIDLLLNPEKNNWIVRW
ncbi:MAG: hypothetical protein JXR48_06390 [Candidatus Delongbacteria bacterium]|nr:hypothetical protein [Candidatus Delongbacteria bacterium]